MCMHIERLARRLQEGQVLMHLSSGGVTENAGNHDPACNLPFAARRCHRP